jgi:hypothetical protein
VPETPTRTPALLGNLAFAIGSWGFAVAAVAANDGFGFGDLVAFAARSALLALPANLVALTPGSGMRAR